MGEGAECLSAADDPGDEQPVCDGGISRALLGKRQSLPIPDLEWPCFAAAGSRSRLARAPAARSAEDTSRSRAVRGTTRLRLFRRKSRPAWREYGSNDRIHKDPSAWQSLST